VGADHWRRRLDRTDLLARLERLKALDHLGPAARLSLQVALGDGAGAVRFHAVTSLVHLARQDPRCRCPGLVAPLLADPVPVVQVAAAEALCRWGRPAAGVPVLRRWLRTGTPAERLHAVIALKRIGPEARPARADLTAAIGDPWRYVGRVARAARRALDGNEP
jgi:HEAT repeat protein